MIASTEDWTQDPWFTRPVLYHWATEASGSSRPIKNDLKRSKPVTKDCIFHNALVSIGISTAHWRWTSRKIHSSPSPWTIREKIDASGDILPIRDRRWGWFCYRVGCFAWNALSSKKILQIMLQKKKKMKTIAISGTLVCHSPDNKYITPVISTALIWRLSIPKTPSNAADPSKITQTTAQDIDSLCISEINK